MPEEAGDERFDWFSFYERLYTMNISTGRSIEPIGLEKYLGPVMAELREHLPASDTEETGNESSEASEQHSGSAPEAGSPGGPPGADEHGDGSRAQS